MAYFNSDGTGAGEVANFQKEISNMMHGFGDNPNPNAATVVLVENIIHQQLQAILYEAESIAEVRGSNNITNYEIIFLMRKNLMKLKRLWEYQLKLDRVEKRGSFDINTVNSNIVFLNDGSDPVVRKKRNHIDIIKELDVKKEVEKIKFDAIEHLRKVRAFKITETMSFEKYQNYHKARCASFRKPSSINKSYVKLEKWLNPTKEFKISTSALEVLSFIAYETVAELVDAVYLIRQDAKKKPGDPFSKLEGGYFCNPGALNNAVYIKSGYEGVNAITVAEIREALRRYFTPKKMLNGLFYRNLGLDIPLRLLAL